MVVAAKPTARLYWAMRWVVAEQGWSLFFLIPATIKDYLGALQAGALVAVVNSPGFKAKVAFLESPLNLNPIFFPFHRIVLNTLQPTADQIADHRVYVFCFLL